MANAANKTALDSIGGGDVLAILAVPSAALHEAVNHHHVDIGTAAKAAKGGSIKVAEVVAKATGSDGKVNGRAAAKVVKEGHEPRPRALNVATLTRIEGEVRDRWRKGGKSAEVAILYAFALGLATARGDTAEALKEPVLLDALTAADVDPTTGKVRRGPNKRTTGKTGA